MLKRLWYVVLWTFPLFGWNSTGEWAGLLAGVLLAVALYGITESVLWLIRRLRDKESAAPD
jgi:hypothetical protein